MLILLISNVYKSLTIIARDTRVKSFTWSLLVILFSKSFTEASNPPSWYEYEVILLSLEDNLWPKYWILLTILQIRLWKGEIECAYHQYKYVIKLTTLKHLYLNNFTLQLFHTQWGWLAGMKDICILSFKPMFCHPSSRNTKRIKLMKMQNFLISSSQATALRTMFEFKSNEKWCKIFVKFNRKNVLFAFVAKEVDTNNLY